MLKRTGRFFLIVSVIMALFFISPALAFTQNISLTSRLDSNTIWLGESVKLTITLEGSEQSFEPEILIPDIKAVSLGGTKRSSESVTSINGKVTRNVSLSYVYTFELTPEKAGKFNIPPITVDIEGESISTKGIQLTVKKPILSDDYHLLLNTDTKSSYISEEIELEISFLFNSSIRELDINIPELEIFSYRQAPSSGGKDQYQININGTPFLFQRSDQTYKGKDYAGISTKLEIKSALPGRKDLSGSTAVFEAVTGTERVRDFFGRIQEQPTYSKIVIPGESDILTINSFPQNNRPENFTGLSGKIEVEISAEPRVVHIGDPITLKIKLSGLNNPEIDLPPLNKLLGNNFDIPDTRSYDTIKGNTKELTQTIRVKSKDVNEIPGISLSYFDTESEEYKEIKTPPIPLDVQETTVLTSSDLENTEDKNIKSSEKTLVEKTKEGIYYNITGPKLLTEKKPLIPSLVRSKIIWFLIGFPPLLYIIFVITTFLIPSLKSRIILNRDKKGEFNALVRKIKNIKYSSPKEYLRICNREINSFVSKYKIDLTNTKADRNLNIINNYIYGKNQDIPEDTKPIIDEILKLFKEEGLV